MMHHLLTNADQKERLSLVYVKALAARAGFTTCKPDPDRDSIDLSIHGGGRRSPALDLQLKATTKLGPEQNCYRSFPSLSIKNYNDLRKETQTPRLLVMLELPQDESDWMMVTPEKLILRRRAYWLSLQGGEHGEVSNKTKVTVRVPVGNVLDVEMLQTLMEKSRKGEIF
ncbi:MAG: hypothetical protein TH68_05765 [Candidatus Synechococcus spongiarum 142]|uniref:DUF4365 domain-containing protein n=1 Tax=Candidatus Synechococcus spongiarum 142 TaxID=1608213 RepID=A0A6N3X073_9SYNE|nr:MAG: hypothetical protein TH68_05765 [Candidatus Synechococcus spongiarum 142]